MRQLLRPKFGEQICNAAVFMGCPEGREPLAAEKHPTPAMSTENNAPSTNSLGEGALFPQ